MDKQLTDAISEAAEMRYRVDVIEVGAECDFRVAKACGIQCEVDSVCAACCIDDVWRIFLPSTDWNDAMLAAERFGIFINREEATRPHCCLLYSAGLWHIADCVGGWEFAEKVSCAETGPLAICRAILKLHGGRDA